MTAKEIVENWMMGWQVPKNIVLSKSYNDYKPAMWQDDSEILKFVEVLLQTADTTRLLALEIGMDKGGTHLLWRHLYRDVITIEINLNLILMLNSCLVSPQHSTFLAANSTLPVTAKLVDDMLQGRQLDLLFIDGDHKYTSVESDFVNYFDYVRDGGVVAFHDSKNINDVARFVSELENGTHSCFKVPFRFQHIRERIGISYFVKGEK